MKAIVIARNDDGSELIEISSHKIQYGGADGDGFCHTHNSFECLENLTEDEKWAVKNAEYHL